jgi:hypothetical protein
MFDMSLSVGDRVIVRNDIEIVQESEVRLWDKEAIVSKLDNFVFPVELIFKDPKIQEYHEELGSRRFDYFELCKIK